MKYNYLIGLHFSVYDENYGLFKLKIVYSDNEYCYFKYLNMNINYNRNINNIIYDVKMDIHKTISSIKNSDIKLSKISKRKFTLHNII